MKRPCDVPGCPNEGTVNVPVGPDTPRVITGEDGQPEFDVSLDDPAPTYVVGHSCPDHVDVVRLSLRERHQPRRQRLREGRP